MFELNTIRVDDGQEIEYLLNAESMEVSMKYEHLTLDRLKKVVSYDPITGVFVWKVRPHNKSRKRIGDQAGSPKATGHRYIGIDGRTYLCSQLAWFYVTGEWARGRIGVKNEKPDDLRFDNLFAYQSIGGRYEMTLEGRAKYRRDHKDALPHVHRSYAWKRLYGIDAETYQRMFAEQGGNCAICKGPERARTPEGELKWLTVDHDHKTGAVRALLCSYCNHTLGHAQDSPERLEAAAAYLREHKAKEIA